MKMASVLSGATTMLPFMRLNEGFFEAEKLLITADLISAFVCGRCLLRQLYTRRPSSITGHFVPGYYRASRRDVARPEVPGPEGPVPQRGWRTQPRVSTAAQSESP